jgi:diguanylate cyclase (GGDEF)-like protein
VLVLQGLQPEPTEAAVEAELVAQKVLQELSRPYTLEDAVLYSTPSIGITLFRNQEQSVHELLKRADLAMYQAKAQGRNTLCFLTRPCRRRHRHARPWKAICAWA